MIIFFGKMGIGKGKKKKGLSACRDLLWGEQEWVGAGVKNADRNTAKEREKQKKRHSSGGQDSL